MSGARAKCVLSAAARKQYTADAAYVAIIRGAAPMRYEDAAADFAAKWNIPACKCNKCVAMSTAAGIGVAS